MMRELFDFLRLKLCVSAMFASMAGFLLFNRPSAQLIPVSLAAFFICAGVYSYNNVTDKKEDEINRGKINAFSAKKEGILIVLLLFSSGLFFSYSLSFYAFFISALFIFLGAAYSYFRLKSFLLVKNLYTAFLVSLFFLLGAGGRQEFSVQFFLYYLLFFTLVLLGSIVSDLRDMEGDKRAGLRTLPVAFGYGKVRAAMCLGIGLSVFLVLLLDFWVLFPVVPSLLIMLFFVIKDEPGKAHLSETISIVFLVLWLLLVMPSYSML